MTKEERSGGRGGLCRPMGDRHGYSRTKLYYIWVGIVGRCIKENNKNYAYFGAKGIKMYEPWANDFIVFMEWAISRGYADGDSIVRTDTDGDYKPDNCYIKSQNPSLKTTNTANRKIPKTKYKARTQYPDRNPVYSTWVGIKTRCYNPNADSYKYYGAKGIYMCDEWKNDFNSFYDWMMANGWEKGYDLDRKDNSKPYAPDNCQLVPEGLNTTKRFYQQFFTPGGIFNKEAYDIYTEKLRPSKAN